jgi:hypothetical protein
MRSAQRALERLAQRDLAIVGGKRVAVAVHDVRVADARVGIGVAERTAGARVTERPRRLSEAKDRERLHEPERERAVEPEDLVERRGLLAFDLAQRLSTDAECAPTHREVAVDGGDGASRPGAVDRRELDAQELAGVDVRQLGDGLRGS